MHLCQHSNWCADQAVMMMKEQDNSYDPQAIAVQTLSGQVLGYVPRGHTTRFPYDTTFGHVYSMGKANSVGLWGATVSTLLPPATITPTCPSPCLEGCIAHPVGSHIVTGLLLLIPRKRFPNAGLTLDGACIPPQHCVEHTVLSIECLSREY